MSQETHCPICYSELEVRDVAPCMECGGLPKELAHYQKGRQYQEVEVLPGHHLVLCNFCMVDFGSYDHSYFGLPRDYPLGFEYMQHVRDASNIGMGKDKFCVTCGLRISFLKFVCAVRRENDA